MKRKYLKSNGYTLVSVLIVTTVMLITLLFLLDVIFSEVSISRNQKSATLAFNLAEAGVQEAIWKLQYDSSVKNTFLNTTNGSSSFSKNNALVSNGGYSVSIENTAKATAIITATGSFINGTKTAQRRIRLKVTKATTPPPYTYDGAIFTGGSTGEEDVTITDANITITGSHEVEIIDEETGKATTVVEPWGSLISNRDIWFTDANINVSRDILAKRNIRNIDSVVNYGGTIDDYAPDTYNMPAIDITSADPGSYKSLAQAQNHYYTSTEIQEMIDGTNTLTLTGIIYVAGSQGLTIEDNKSLVINGILVIEGSIDVGKPNKKGALTINHVDGQPSGLITLGKLTAQANSQISISGLTYIGDRFSFDPYDHSNPNSLNINFTGGILCRRFSGNGPRNIVINFNQDWINEALLPNPTETPVIVTQHWEEEY